MAAGMFAYFRGPIGAPLRYVIALGALVVVLLEDQNVVARILVELAMAAFLWFLPQLSGAKARARSA
jgi:hypothetical protein